MRITTNMMGAAVAAGLVVGAAALAADPSSGKSAYAKWQRGPSTSPDFFPIGVWLQPARYIPQYKEAGVNIFVGIWQGPKNAEQIKPFSDAGMYLICQQTEAALAAKDNPIIIGWQQQDEPDNAQPVTRWKSAEEIKKNWPESPDQPLEKWGTYGPPIAPKTIIAKYEEMKANDPTRPVFLNLGQAVGFPDYVGRGYRRRRMEDYPEYLKGCDIVSFDLYAYTFPNPEIKEKIWKVAEGVDNLKKWAGDRQIVWNFVEATLVYKGGKMPTPAITKAEVWMSIVHGSTGILYYAHGRLPGVEAENQEHALVSDTAMMAALKEINGQVHRLARVINSPAVSDAAKVTLDNQEAVVDFAVRKTATHLYLFAVGMRPVAAKATFAVKGLANAQVEVIDEGRTLELKGGSFADSFDGHAVHLYRVPLK